MAERTFLPSRTAAEIATTAEDRLSSSNSSIVLDPEQARLFREQVEAVVAEVADETRRQRAQPFDPTLSTAVGVRRAAGGIPPAESLFAAQVLFEAALPILVETRIASPSEIAIGLHRAILRRIVQGSMSYVDTLLDRLRRSDQEERHRIARDLHDRVAHAVAIALQQLELYDLYAGPDPERALECLRSAREALTESITAAAAVTTELQDTLGGRDLVQALCRYVDRFAPGLEPRVQIVGDPAELPLHLAEQLYLVLREAIHNAVLHADPSVVDVAVELAADRVTATVVDDGIGFQPRDGRGDGIGLSSMRERLALLGGTMTVDSARGRGAQVCVTLPLSGGPL